MSADHCDVLIDAHVHYHSGFERGAFFDAASGNFSAGAGELDLRGPCTGVLMFTESAGADAFGRFAAEASPAGVAVEADAPADRPGGAPETTGGWRFRRTGEDNSLWAVPGDAEEHGTGTTNSPAAQEATPRAEILVVAGRQIVTSDRLEVLALGCRGGIDDGAPLRPTRDAVIAAGGIPVVPWGFGKWWFSRGRRLERLVRADSPGMWFLGDNAGRPALSRQPGLCDEAARHGVFVLPGSDPLPLSGQEAKAGRCGVHLPQRLDERRPAASILDCLRGCTRQPVTYGRYEGLFRFGRDQLAMQMRRRGGAEGIATGAPLRGGRPGPPAPRGDAP